MTQEFKKSRIISSELRNHVGSKILISGFLHKKRSLGKLTFLLVRDRHGLIQIIVEDTIETEKLKGIYTGSILNIEGIVKEESAAPNGFEIHNPKIEVDIPVKFISPIEIDKPIDHNAENLNTLFEYRVLNMRNINEQKIFKMQTSIGDLVREYLNQNDFVEFHSPKILAGSTEGGAEVFKINYFGRQATLAQSAQFYKQIMVGAFERVFEFGSTYRAEPSMTTRHMTEFMTIDVEMGFINNVKDIIKLLNKLLIFTVDQVWSKFSKELKILNSEKPVLSEIFPVIPLAELHDLVFKETGQDFRAEKDPTPFEERWICQYSKEHWNCEAVFITEFPASDMKFYHYKNDINPNVADRFDLLFKGVEISTGSRREHRYDQLIKQLESIGADPEDIAYKYYLQGFKHGMPSHGGFGLGLERLAQKIIGLNNVKEAVLFPRDMHRLAP